MSKATLVSEFACTSKLPILAHFGLIFSFVLLDELTSFFGVIELFSFRLDIYFEGISFREVYRAHTA